MLILTFKYRTGTILGKKAPFAALIDNAILQKNIRSVNRSTDKRNCRPDQYGRTAALCFERIYEMKL